MKITGRLRLVHDFFDPDAPAAAGASPFHQVTDPIPKECGAEGRHDRDLSLLVIGIGGKDDGVNARGSRFQIGDPHRGIHRHDIGGNVFGPHLCTALDLAGEIFDIARFMSGLALAHEPQQPLLVEAADDEIAVAAVLLSRHVRGIVTPFPLLDSQRAKGNHSTAMKSTDLNLNELLNFSPEGGLIQFGPLRVILMDTSALGLFRKELIDNLGWSAARVLLSRFGFAQGWRAAESLHADFPWDSDDEWRQAGAGLHTLLGHVVVDERSPGEGDHSDELQAVWKDSYEAEQHLLQIGRSEEPVCWTLTGFLAGYMSRAQDREIVARESRCRAKGDAACRVVAKPYERWQELGEDDVIVFPRESLYGALTKVTEALKDAEKNLRRHVRQIHSGTSDVLDPSGIIAASDSMKKTLDIARRVARVDSSVLLTGESGVGKERIARLIHEESERAARPFVAVNCGAVTESLLESELFGHVRGSFTGATQDRIGLFEAAHHGTIFLDEIGELAQSMQVKLLRVLQEREIRRVGESRVRKVDARVIAATNRDLAEEVAAGRFRDDLYYRLRVIELRIPPLRDRRQDILPIARRVLTQLSRKLQRDLTGFTSAAADLLLRYPWPGNVRELQNAVEHAVVLADGPKIDTTDLPEEVRLRSTHRLSLDTTRTLAEVERDYILAVLEANGGNQAKTAERLKIGTATLYRRLRAYGIDSRST